MAAEWHIYEDFFATEGRRHRLIFVSFHYTPYRLRAFVSQPLKMVSLRRRQTARLAAQSRFQPRRCHAISRRRLILRQISHILRRFQADAAAFRQIETFSHSQPVTGRQPIFISP